jgi:hypothetical protein
MFIVWNFDKASLEMIKVAAAQIGEEAKEYNIGCFDRTPQEKPITEVIFIAHGSRNRFGGSNDEENIDGLTPKEFVKFITSSSQKLPASVKNLCLCGCHIGLAQPPKPSYLARVAEELAKHPDYKNVIVRGIQVENYDKKYSHLIQTHHLDEETNKHLMIDYYLFTKEEYDLRKQYREEHKNLVETAGKLKIEIKKLSSELSGGDEKNGRKKLLQEKKDLLSQIKKIEEAMTNQTEKSQEKVDELSKLQQQLDENKKNLSAINQSDAESV